MLKINKDMNKSSDKIITNARFSENYEYIIDSDGNRVELTDSRIVFVILVPRKPYEKRLVMKSYEKFGTNVRISSETDADVLNYAKRLCSGRECLPSMAIAGNVLKDLYEHRKENEITIYCNPLDAYGPCQYGAWPVVWDVFTQRLNTRNAIFFPPLKPYTNYLGLNPMSLRAAIKCYTLAHILFETRNTLYCIAQDTNEGMNAFEKSTDRLIDGFDGNINSLTPKLKQWSQEVSEIPRKASIEETPKVLIFGGLNLLFAYYPIEKYFLNQGIIPKVVDLVESFCLMASETALRCGFRQGIMSPKDQLNISSFQNYDELSQQEKEEVTESLLSIQSFEHIDKSFRRVMRKSGLLFDKRTSFIKLMEKGHQYVSSNSFTESTLTVGRFLQSVEDEIYNGFVNIVSFNCHPSKNAHTIIQHIITKVDVPYTHIECEGPWITGNQEKLLETVAVQAKRLKGQKIN